MDGQRLIEELVGLLEKNGYVIRRESLGGGGGGLCRMKNEMIFFLDTDSPSMETAQICADAVRELVDLDNVYIRPEVRELIESRSKSS